MTYEELVAQVQAGASKMDAKTITDHLAVQFNVEGEAEGAFYLEISSGHISVEPYEYYDHDVVVIASAKQILDIFSGKLDPAKALEQGKIKAEGNGGRLGLLNEIIKKTPSKKAAPAKKAEAKKEEPKKAEVKKEESKKVEAVKKEEPKKAEAVKKEEPKKAEPAKKEEPKKVEAVKKEEPKKAEAVKKEEPKKAEKKKADSKKSSSKKSK